MPTQQPRDGRTRRNVVDGAIMIAGERGRMLVFVEDADVTMRAARDARTVLLGGAVDGVRYIWWNFVASSGTRPSQNRHVHPRRPP